MMYVIIFWLIGIFMIGTLCLIGIGIIREEIKDRRESKEAYKKEKFYHIISQTNLKEGLE